MSQTYIRALILIAFSLLSAMLSKVHAHEINAFPDLIAKITPSVVGIGVLTPLEGNAAQLQGTGFVIGNGQYIVTNYHVVSQPLDIDKVQHRVVLQGQGRRPRLHQADIVASDPIHDLAILKLNDNSVKLPSRLKVYRGDFVRPGTEVAFTGFPIGAVLGLYPATHSGFVAAITPDATPIYNGQKLQQDLLSRLENTFMVYQLDATAYPGNSGSAMYNKRTGEVLGVINKVFVHQGKESALSTPSGITYAIPVEYLIALAEKNKIAL